MHSFVSTAHYFSRKWLDHGTAVSQFLCVCIAMDWIASPRNSYVEALSPKAAGFRDNACKEVIKSRWSYKVGLWSQRISDLLRVAGDHTAAAARHKAHRSSIHKPRQEPSPEVKLCWSLDLKLWPPGRWRTHCAQTVTFCQQPKQTNKYSIWMFPIAKLFPKMYQPLPHQHGSSLSDIWASPEHPLLSPDLQEVKGS